MIHINTPRPLVAIGISSLFCFYPFIVNADEFSAQPLIHSQSDFGGVGLMQMPSARMMDDGFLGLNITNNEDYLNYAVSLQVFPWLESTVRYTQVHDKLYSGDASFSGDTEFTDKSIDAKFNLTKEHRWWPQISIGLRDIGGTGVFDGEFIAANKLFGPLDVTLGLGWGYIGNRNNLGSATSDRDCGRNTGYSGSGGNVELSKMFTGCKSLFGGIEYQTPFDPLVVKVEYDGNNYKSEYATIDKGVDSPWNIGLIYSLSDWAAVRLSYERGNIYTAGITLSTNLATLTPIWLDEKAADYQPKDEVSELSDQEWQQLSHDLQNIAGYQEAVIYQDQESVTVAAPQVKYRERNEAVERGATILANSGIKAEQYRFVETAQTVPQNETVVEASAFKAYINNEYAGAQLDDAAYNRSPEPISGEEKSDQRQAWHFGVTPSLQQAFGGSESFYLYAIGVKADAGYQPLDKLMLSGSLYGNIYNNYDQFKYTVPPDGTDLKRVRTLARQYNDQAVRLDNLQMTYFDRFGHNFYTQAYAGYLEFMFAGVGSEILYRPYMSNWAFGIDGNYVKQRDPDQLLGLYSQELHYDPTTGRNYRVQTGTFTGHGTIYWQPQLGQWLDNTLFKVSGGQYLTGDKGVTVDFSRQFDSGVIVGAFATKTNLSAAEYGEGSFTKGFYISIPLDLMTVKPSLSRANISWIPITRDGGQPLNRQFSLYDMTDARSPWFTREIQE